MEAQGLGDALGMLGGAATSAILARMHVSGTDWGLAKGGFGVRGGWRGAFGVSRGKLSVCQVWSLGVGCC